MKSFIKYINIIHEISNPMNNSNTDRKARFNNIRASLQQIPGIKKNTAIINQKIQKRAKKKKSLLGEIQNITESQINEILQKDQQDLSMSKFKQKYQLGEKIGEGSNGTVRKCYLKQTGQLFAVKSINMDEQHIMFLKQNFKYIKSLNHPHIIRYHIMYLDNRKKTCHLVMDYDNSSCLLKYTHLNEQEIRSIMQQLVNTLAYIHTQNICHRDIKPENILYDEVNNKIKLIDFGISKKIIDRGAKRDMLTITGTLYYRAPEMFLGGGYDEKVDMWAAGITLYQLINEGKTPFQSEYLSTTIQNITRGEVQYQEKYWGSYKFAKDLVSRLVKKSNQRLTAAQAKKHFWFQQCQNSYLNLIRSDSLRQNQLQSILNKNYEFGSSFKLQRALTNTMKLQKGNRQIEKDTEKVTYDLKRWLIGRDEDVVESQDEQQYEKITKIKQKS